MNGKSNINWNHYKSMQATINTMFVNENILRIYSLCPFSPWNTRKMHFKRSIVTKKVPPLDPNPPWGVGCPWKNLASSSLMLPIKHVSHICDFFFRGTLGGLLKYLKIGLQSYCKTLYYLMKPWHPESWCCSIYIAD